MIFAGDKFGHPWHGAWSGATGKITTPAGGDIDCPGLPPTVRSQNLPMRSDTAHSGDCYLLAVPDMPAVTTSPEDAAAGKTWLNYGLISGAKNRLMGIELGRDGWIYIAPDKTRWRVEFSHAPLTMASSLTTTFGVTFRRFGEFDGAAEDTTQSFNLFVVNLALDRPSGADSAYPASGAEAARAYICIEDIRPDGARVLLAVQSELPVDACPLSGRVLFSVVELRITGTPPAAAASVVTVLATSAIHTLTIRHRWQKFCGVSWYTDDDEVDQVYVGGLTDSASSFVAAYMSPNNIATFVGLENTEPWGDGWPDDASAGHIEFKALSARYDYTSTTVVSARYNSLDGRVEKVVADVACDTTFNCSVTPVAGPGFEWSGSGSLSGSGSVSLSSVDVVTGGAISSIGTYPISVSATWSGANPGGGSWSGTYSLNGETTAFSAPSLTNVVTGFFVEPPIGVVCSSMPKHGDGRFSMYGGGASELVLPLRYSNAVVGFARKTLPFAGITRPLLFWSVFGKVGSDLASVAATTAPTWPVYVSEHPITGAILRSSAAVAWV